MNLSIDPYVGVGPIKLGMTAEDVRKAIGLPFRAFMKSKLDLIPTDAFEQAGIYVYYRAPGVVEAVEMTLPANPLLNGRTLLEVPYSTIRDWILNQDANLEANGTGLTSAKLGIGIYAPFALKHPEDITEAVIVFERGYYEEIGSPTEM